MKTSYLFLCVTCFILVTSTCSCDDPAAPEVPPEASILLLSHTGQEAFLTWTECQASDFYSYRLYRSTEPSVADQDTASMFLVCSTLSNTLTSATDSTLVFGTYYYYALLTSDSKDLRSWSNETATLNLHPTPSELSGDDVAEKQVLLSWTQCPDQDFQSYSLYRSLTEDIAEQDSTQLNLLFSTTDPTAISYADSSLEEMNTYFYALQTKDSGELTAWSNEISVYAEIEWEFPHEVTGIIPIENGYDVCFSPVGGSAFVTTIYDASVHMINTETETVDDVFHCDEGYLMRCCIDENGQYLFSTWYETIYDDYASAIVITDASTNNLVKTIPLPDENARGLCCIPGRDEIYVCMATPGTAYVRIIDVNTLQLSGEIESSWDPNQICSDPAGENAYITKLNTDYISIIDTETREITGSILASLNDPGRICITPDEKYLYYNSYDEIGIVYLPTGTCPGLITMPSSTGALCPDPTGKYIYVGMTNSIGVIDTELRELVHVFYIPGAGFFGSIDFSPDGTKLYALTDEGVYVIE